MGNKLFVMGNNLFVAPREPTCHVVDENGKLFTRFTKGNAYVTMTTPFVWQRPKQYLLDKDDVANIKCYLWRREYYDARHSSKCSVDKAPECKFIKTASHKLFDIFLTKTGHILSIEDAMYMVYQKRAEEEELRSLNFRPF